MNYLRCFWLLFVRTIESVIKIIKYYLFDLPRFTFRNTHNNTRLVYPCWTNLDRISIWAFSYWPIDFRSNWNVDIKIWNYCAIAKDVVFIALDHPIKHLNQHGFPFWDLLYNKILNPLYKWPYTKNKSIISYKCDKWPIIVDDDVRIWTWAKIMSWVHIWQWAVIAAWAVVTKDIPPYAIAWWVPAKVIKYRFPKDTIEKLLQIDYANTPIEKFWKIYPETIKEDFDIDYILEKINQ